MAQYSTINFLRERVRLQEAVVIADRRFALLTSIVLGVFITIVISVAGYQAFLSRQLEKLTVATETETQTLRSFSVLQSELSARNSTIATIRSIFDKRGKKWDAITYFYKELPQDAVISTVNLSSLDGTLQFTVTSPTVFAFSQLSEKLQSPEVKASGYLVNLGALTRARTGIYELSVKLAVESGESKTTSVPKGEQL